MNTQNTLNYGWLICRTVATTTKKHKNMDSEFDRVTVDGGRVQRETTAAEEEKKLTITADSPNGMHSMLSVRHIPRRTWNVLQTQNNNKTYFSAFVFWSKKEKQKFISCDRWSYLGHLLSLSQNSLRQYYRRKFNVNVFVFTRALCDWIQLKPIPMRRVSALR